LETTGSKNPADMGTIRREGSSKMENPQRLYVRARPEKLNAQWVVGFVDGEGCFFVGINPHPEMSCQFQVLPEFTVVQHRRDIQLLHALKKFFGCGVVRSNHADRMSYRVRGLDHLAERIVPFFEQHPLKSKKRVDFARFRKILHLIRQGKHLNLQGIEEIKAIASTMNTGRARESPASLETE
jgi:LAGLIDADG endonuclease